MVLLDGTMVVAVSTDYVIAITEDDEVIIEGIPCEGMEEIFAQACVAAYTFQGFAHGKKTTDSET